MQKSKKGIKIITNTIHNGSGSGRLLCPMCTWFAVDAIMVYNNDSGVYVCSECGYQTRGLDPIHESKIEAANEITNQKPYFKSVSFAKKPEKESDNSFQSFEEAWRS